VAEGRDELRAADVDRTFVAERLKGALNEGRLSLSEYDERLQQTYAAKTYGDLDRVMGDLPHPASARDSQVVPTAGPPGGWQQVPATPSYASAYPSPDRRAVPRWLAAVWGAWLIAVSVNVVIWLLVSLSAAEVVYFWPMWVAGPWGAVLLAMTVSGLMRGEPHRPPDQQAADRSGRDTRRDARRDARRQRRTERGGY
jgi:hypothetical protein